MLSARECFSAGMRAPVSVLLVEDHELLRKTLRRSLNDDPDVAVVGEASDGVEAVRLTSQLEPQVVVMDLEMPVMDGLTAAERIIAKQPSTAIVMLSMNTQQSSIRAALAAGVRAYVVKNADLDLAAVIKNVVSGDAQTISPTPPIAGAGK
jgi:DNA-binding NarL/FixJ family response regulator